jgi:hypothetical protein
MQPLIKNYTNFDEACKGVIEILTKSDQSQQTHVIANYEGRSFTVKTEQGKLTNINEIVLDDFFSQEAMGRYERKITVHAQTNQDMVVLNDRFCGHFGTQLVTICLIEKK